MRYGKKNVFICIYTLILLLAVLFIMPKESAALPGFSVYDPSGFSKETVTVYDAGDENYYVFLPSYAKTEQVTISLTGRNSVSIGDIPVHDGMDCGSFALECPYEYSVNGKPSATIWFYRSENVATLYIHTAHGGMEQLHEDKNNKATVEITLRAADGTVDYSSKNSTLKGRGNSTWNYDKHPYSLRLSSADSLLGMKDAANWVLLANAHDETNLNNKLVFDLASRAGLSWVPDCRWVDVYINGTYNGLYLLTEKVEVQKNRLNIDTASGEFLCKVDYLRRWEDLRNPFLSEAGHAVEICYPEIITEATANTVHQLVRQMENALLSGEDLRDSSLIDLDSWVRRYLIDEISGNADSELASCYFYFSKGTFYAGPLWDYDLTFGNHYRNQEPHAFIAKNFRKAGESFSPYYSALYSNPSVQQRMKELYVSEFKPLIREMLDREIDDLAMQLGKASRMNSIRWRDMFRYLQSTVPNSIHTPEGIKEYLSRRTAFLDSVWADNIPYCTVQFEVSEYAYWNISVEQGSCLETTYMDTVSTVWTDTATGEVFDFSQPIMTDLILSRQPVEVLPQDTPSADSSGGTAVLSMAVLLILLLIFILIDATRRRKKRLKAEMIRHTNVSA